MVRSCLATQSTNRLPGPDHLIGTPKALLDRRLPAIQALIAGNRTTSRIDSLPVSNITSRSMPSPTPPAGGMPCSSACRNDSSNGWESSLAGLEQALLGGEALALDVGVGELAEGVGDLDAAGERLPALDQPGRRAVGARERRQLDRVVEHEARLLQARLDVLGEQVVGHLGPAGALGRDLQAAL